MFSLTRQERLVLVTFFAVLLIGTVMDYAAKRFPSLKNKFSFLNNSEAPYQLDVNRATKDELIAIPYIGEYTAARIIEYRQANGPFRTLDQLKYVKGIKDKNFAIFAKYLKIR